MSKLFGGRIKPECRHCREAMQQIDHQVLCMKKGIVAADYVCRKYVYEPTLRIPSRPIQLDLYLAEDFSIL